MGTRSCLCLGLLLSAVLHDANLAQPCLAGQNVVVVLDDSGSMNQHMLSNRDQPKMEAAKQALLTVLADLPEDTKVGIVVLNGQRGADNWVVPLAPVDLQSARTAVQAIHADGGTPLGAFMKVGADALLQARAKEHYGIYRLLVVTDGEAGDAKLVEQHLPDILTRGITVDVIGVNMKQDHSLATKVHTYRRADDPESLRKAVSDVFAESTVDPNNAGESDFELLAPIPRELAEASLAALAESGNHPIGEPPPSQFSAIGSAGAPQATSPPGAVPAKQPPGRGKISWWILGGFALIFYLVFRRLLRPAR